MGPNTGINYLRDFEEYLEILVTGLQKRKKSVLNVFREWEKVIFPNSDSSFVGEAQGTTSGLKTAMEMLDADESESEGESQEEFWITMKLYSSTVVAI